MRVCVNNLALACVLATFVGPIGADEVGGVRAPENDNTRIQADLADLTGVDIVLGRGQGLPLPICCRGAFIVELTARGATVTENFGRLTPALLANYDVVWLVDTTTAWDAAEIAALGNWINAGGGLLLEGDGTSTVSIFNELLTDVSAGIEYSTADGASGTTSNIHPHQATQDVMQIYLFDNAASIPTIVAPAVPLVDAVNGVGAAAASEIGAGRIFATSDQIFDNTHIGLADNQLFGNQVMDWLADHVGACCRIEPTEPICSIGPSSPCGDFYLGDGTGCEDCRPCRAEPAFVDFGAVPLGQCEDRVIQLSSVDLEISNTTLTSSCSAVSFPNGPDVTIPSSGSVSVTVRFTPTIEDTILAEITPGCPVAVWVMGSGIGPSTFPDCNNNGIADDCEPSSDWVDVTTAPLDDPGSGHAVAWGDYDNDGLLDLYVSNYGTANKLFHNEGGGVFSDATNGPLGDTGNGTSAAWGDYDNDGFLDLYLANLGTANKLFRNEGDGSFTDATSVPLGNTDDGIGVAWGDYDNDGWLDIYLGNGSPGANKLFRNQGDGTFTDATSGPLGDTGSARGVAWGDYDNDGLPDLYLAKWNATNKLFHNEGGGVFTDVTSGPLVGTGKDTGVAWGDYDNDGLLDLFVAAFGTANTLLHNEGDGSFSDATSGALGDADAQGAVWGDYDNDGRLDLYVVANSTTSPENRLFHNEGGGVFTLVSGVIQDPGLGRGTGWGDYDNDGRLDTYVANNGTNKLFSPASISPLCNHWLHVKLVGSTSNMAGIGARVRLVTGGVSQIREISGGSYLSQNSLTAEFGLGATTLVDTLEVRWPSSLLETWVNGFWARPVIPIDTLITLVEGDIAVDVADERAAPAVYRLHPNVPNPFNPVTTIRYDLPQPSGVELRVYDVAGRLVRVLENSVYRERGRHRVLWHGRDESGRKVSSGIYVYRLTTGSYTASRRMVLLR